MAVTVKDLLQLPSFRGSEVVAGRNRLHQTVSSLSVLEVADVDFFSQIIQTVQEEWYAEELVISSFYSIKDSVEHQCRTIQYLHDLGEVGLILYYVGIIMPDIPDEVLQLADSLDFIIICMPRNDYSLRYNEVIYEVMETIVSNQNVNEHFVNESLEKVTRLPEHLRSVEITLKLLSDRMKANIVLTNSKLDIINRVMWPRNSTLDVSELIRSMAPAILNSRIEVEMPKLSSFVEYRRVHQKNGEALYLFLIKENSKLPPKTMDQISEVVQVALNLWGDKHNEVSEYALVRAIVNDESEKMRRLASRLHIDVSVIQMMWLVYIQDLSEEKTIREDLRTHLSQYYKTAVIQTIDRCIVVLLGNCSYKYKEFDIAAEYIETTSLVAEISNIVYSPRMRNTQDVRRMYQLVNSVGNKVQRIYHGRKLFTSAEYRSMKRAIDLSKQGEEMIEECLAVIDLIRDDPDALTTLMTFLLDAKGNIDECSRLLFVHKNTVKYRIKKISELLGYDITIHSESYEIYTACMVYRLIHS
ncbi:PucR family transcriptional regulator [Paenibacillus sp. J22TS3]|uniref:PucR family transcriptional regulator n=1 Tax=Paenibacillus sp. J22TS3 TaxID=2807192 RepID=UPI001B019E18|nr:PucR family transcriptional regulator [Paenibacillus sp. J22TS3]GIP23102.1 purine catabolism regulatory protein [Paenibacillus sp. J22TS3]